MLEELFYQAMAARERVKDPDTVRAVRSTLWYSISAEYPEVSRAVQNAQLQGFSRRGLVAAVVAAMINMNDPNVSRALREISEATTWNDVKSQLKHLGFAGNVLTHPQDCGVMLYLDAAKPEEEAWGLSQIAEAASLVKRPREVTVKRGYGWSFVPA